MPRLSLNVERIVSAFALIDDLWAEVQDFLTESLVNLFTLAATTVVLLYGVYVVALIIGLVLMTGAGYVACFLGKELWREAYWLAIAGQRLLHQPLRLHVRWWR